MSKKLFELTCKKCGKTFYHPNKHKQYCCDECKKSDKKLLICPICGKEFLQNAPAQKYCSEECHLKAKANLARQRIIEQSKIEFTGEEGIDYVECKICGQRMNFFHVSHLALHNISKEEYEAKYGKIVSYPLKYKEEHFVGENNPSHSSRVDEQTRKERSPFSKEYYKKRGLSENDRVKFNKNVAKNRSYNTTLEFYINKGYSEEEAKAELKKRQQTFTLEKCIERYGIEEGTKRWKERQDKWKLKVFADGNRLTCGRSNACEKLVNLILENTSNINLRYGNNELRIYDNKTMYLYDITNESNKKIIEFNGDMWHGNPKIYKSSEKQKITNISYKKIWEKDKIKKEVAEQHGYEVMIVWESEFYKNEEDVVQKCKKFILS